jgi:hypothetical protein
MPLAEYLTESQAEFNFLLLAGHTQHRLAQYTFRLGSK